MKTPALLPCLVLALSALPARSVADAAPSASLPSTAAASSPESKVRGSARPVAGHYIVVLLDAAVPPGEVEGVAQELARRHNGQVIRSWRSALRGFVARMNAAQAGALADDPRVAWVEEDGEIRIDTTQAGATWGLDRIDQRSRALDGAYAYHATGAGVNAYVIDSGIRVTHAQFGGRAVGAFTAIGDGYGTSDCNGHGTHVAGTVGGAVDGVAKGVRLFAVRVLDCAGSGTTSGVISGVDWVTANHVAPAVANMSLGGGASSSLDLAVQRSIESGVTYVVAAGNGSVDACTASPARVAAALTVGATDSTDAKASFSNFGGCLDLFAPGTSITSAWPSSDTATAALSGTSMAAPHVTGAAALQLSVDPAATPAQVASALLSNATVNALSLVGPGSPNRLLYEAFIGAGSPPPACASASQLVVDGGFEAGTATAWTATSGVIDGSPGAPAHSGAWKAWLNGYGRKHTDSLHQVVSIPADACSATLDFWLWVASAETSAAVNDVLSVTIRDPAGRVLATLATYSNRDASAGYEPKSFDLTPFRGSSVRIQFDGTENSSLQTSFLVDDVALTVVQ